jgi:hypothetical protein
MSAYFLTTNSSLRCPHGGTITASTTNTRVKAGGQFVLRSTDSFTVGGCTHMIGNVWVPCVSVRWDVHAERHQSQGDPSLTESSEGQCLNGAGGMQGIAQVSARQQRGAGS